MTIKSWELKNAIIDTVEVYLRDNAGYYALNHASAAEFFIRGALDTVRICFLATTLCVLTSRSISLKKPILKSAL